MEPSSRYPFPVPDRVYVCNWNRTHNREIKSLLNLYSLKLRHSLNYQEWVAWIPTLQIAPIQGRASAIQLVSLIVQILYFSYWLLYNLYSTSNGIINNCRIVRFH